MIRRLCGWSSRSAFAVTMILAICAGSLPCLAAPVIGGVSLRGLQTGAVTTLVVTGSELSQDVRLLSSCPLGKVVVKPGAKADRVELEVTVDAAARPDVYSFWLANPRGISGPILLGVEALAQQPAPPGGAAPATIALPAAYTGNLGGSDIQRFTFTGKAGQRVVADVEARRLGANFNPVLRLIDPRGVQLAFSQSDARLSGDARLSVTLKSDGPYVLELHDLAYRAGGPGHYRLKVGDLQYADFALPGGVKIGAAGQFAFASTNLPDAARSSFAAPADLPPGDLAAPLPPGKEVIGPAPRLVASTLVEIAETPPAGGKLPEATAPTAISGVISTPGEEDRFLVTVAPNAKLRLELLAARSGSPLDSAIAVRNEQGGQLAFSDDQPGTTDSGLDFTVPAGTTKLVVAVKDAAGRGGPEFAYRLVIRDASGPDFSLAVGSQQINIPAGGSQTLRVDAVRSGYTGPIALAFAGLPAGVTVTGGEIPPQSSFTLVQLSAPTGGGGAGLALLVGRGGEGAAAIVRRGLAPETPAARIFPWQRSELGIGIGPAAPLAVAWAAPKAGEKLPLGGKAAITVQLTRSAGVAGPVRLKIVTTQPPVKKKEKKDGKDVEVDDVDRMLRLEASDFEPAAAQAATSILVPADLPPQVYGVAVVAELLDGEKKNVLATTGSEMRFFPAAK